MAGRAVRLLVLPGQLELGLGVVLVHHPFETQVDVAAFAGFGFKTSPMDILVAGGTLGFGGLRRRVDLVAVLTTILSMLPAQRPADLGLVIKAGPPKLDRHGVTALAVTFGADDGSMTILVASATVREILFDLEGRQVLVTSHASTTGVVAGDGEIGLIVVELGRTQTLYSPSRKVVTDRAVCQRCVRESMGIDATYPG